MSTYYQITLLTFRAIFLFNNYARIIGNYPQSVPKKIKTLLQYYKYIIYLATSCEVLSLKKDAIFATDSSPIQVSGYSRSRE